MTNHVHRNHVRATIFPPDLMDNRIAKLSNVEQFILFKVKINLGIDAELKARILLHHHHTQKTNDSQVQGTTDSNIFFRTIGVDSFLSEFQTIEGNPHRIPAFGVHKLVTLMRQIQKIAQATGVLLDRGVGAIHALDAIMVWLLLHGQFVHPSLLVCSHARFMRCFCPIGRECAATPYPDCAARKAAYASRMSGCERERMAAAR